VKQRSCDHVEEDDLCTAAALGCADSRHAHG
jgi:hypothetical protein